MHDAGRVPCPWRATPCRSPAPSAAAKRRRSAWAGAAPKNDGRQAHFYAIIARDSNDQEFAAERQRFRAEQDYAYTIVDAKDL
jgi:hypothetical protein